MHHSVQTYPATQRRKKFFTSPQGDSRGFHGARWISATWSQVRDTYGVETVVSLKSQRRYALVREIVGAFRWGASVNSDPYRETDVQARDSKRHVKENKGSILDGPFVGGLARGGEEGQILPLSGGIGRQGTQAVTIRDLYTPFNSEHNR